MGDLTIWKFDLLVRDETILTIPVGAVALSVQMQGLVPRLWALVDPEAPQECRRLRLYGTGHSVEPGGAFVGTFQVGGLVFHLFDYAAAQAEAALAEVGR